MVRRLTNAEARRGTGVADWLLYALLLLQLVDGIFVALFHPWASSWNALLVAPYLQSLVKLNPEISYMSGMPHAVKVHVVGAYLLLIVLPFTRLVRPLVQPVRDKEESVVGNPLVTTVFLVGLGFSLVTLVPRVWAAHRPGSDQGYEPVQPIAFSHRLHAGGMQISCLYCHSGAEKGPHAGIPAASICMNCHRTITAPLDMRLAEFEQAREEKRPAGTVISPEAEKTVYSLGPQC